jgi:hypothetical protein
VFKAFQNRNCRGHKNDNSDTGKNKKYERGDQFYGRFSGHFFRFLPALSPQGVGEAA